jgi:Cupin domain
MSQALPPIRRIVTGVDEQGRSCIVADGESPAVRLVAERPGYRVTNVWRTLGSDRSAEDADTIAAHEGIAPPPRGTILRIIDIPPEATDAESRKRHAAATFKQLYADADHTLEHRRHPGMHRTDSVDYAIVLEGELTAILDKDETIMRAGDVLIQRGTDHAWANRSGKMVRIAFILIAAARRE